MNREEDKTIGFDRKIELGWLDTTAELCASGRSPAEIRARLHALLDGKVAGDVARSARHKTVTVLMHVWCAVPPHLAMLRDEGLDFVRAHNGRDRLPLHWGMAIATYPFFREVAAVTGRLIGLQGNASLQAIVRRVRERRGQRSGLDRAVQRVARSFVDWGVLEEGGPRGRFRPPEGPVQPDEAVSGWLFEALLWSDRARRRPLLALARDPSLFPFALAEMAPSLRRRPRIETYQHGLDEQLVTINTGKAGPERRV